MRIDSASHPSATTASPLRERHRAGRRLVFEGPAPQWLDALPIGNGRIGAMCGGDASAAVLDLNEETVWSGAPGRDERQRPLPAAEAQRLLARAREAVLDGRPREAEALLKRRQSSHSQAYLPVGRLVVADEVPDHGETARELNLATAIHSAQTGGIRTETFVSAPAQVLVHAVRGGSGRVRLDFTSQLRESSRETLPDGLVVRLQTPVDVAPAHAPDLPAAIWPDGGERSVEVVVVIRWRARVKRTVVVVAIETTYAGPSGQLGSVRDAEERARERAERAGRTPYHRLRAEHVAAHAALFDRVRLDLGRAPDASIASRLERSRPRVAESDPDLVATLFDYGRYLLISCSRPGGLPATLQGIWNAEMRPPWSSNYTLNINTEMNYWASEITALPETVEPLTRFIGALAARGERTATHDYGAAGWVAHHNSDAWAFTATTGAGEGDPSWAFWPFAGPWLVRHLAEHVAFGSAPEGFVADTLRPLARGAARFVLAWLRADPDGVLGTAPSTSPENTFRIDGEKTGVGVSSTMDISLARELLATMLAVEPDHDEPLARSARRALDALPSPSSRAGEDGVREWGLPVEEVDPHHRHVSHLYALYPGDDADERFAGAAAQALDRRGLDSTGWSLVWKMALWARLGRPDRVSALLELFFRDAHANSAAHAGGLYANLLAAHPPFQIDGNLGFVAAFAECLLQSHRNRIELLPALPPALSSGSVSGLVARPGVLVDLEWAEGALVQARLRARTGRDGLVRVTWAERAVDVQLASDADTVLSASDFRAVS